MDDRFARQYDYKANSNLVLQTDTSLIDKRANNEGTGEVQSLAGRLGGKMGDKVASKSSVKPSKRDEDDKSRAKRTKKSEPSKLKQELSAPRDFSVAEIETKDLLYQPKTDLTAAVYGLLIKFVRKQLGFQHNSIINGAADEIIGTMKDPKLAEDMRRSEIDRLLSTDQCLDDDDYNELCNLCKKINDWDSDPTKVKEDTAEEESGGIAVLVSDEDVLSDDYLSEVHDEDDEFDLDEMFERAEENNQEKDTELTDFIPKQAKITPKIDIGEPIRKEGYQEYHIVPPKRQSHRNDNLIKVEDLPENQRRAFRDFKSLNLIQSRIYNRAMNSDKSMLICAPTGAGKTNIAILTMLREILKHQREDGSGFRTDKFKIIYVAPIKALVQEIVENFTRRLGCSPYNLKVEELTGDHQLNERQISGSQIIVCTPEKWDIVTRKSVDRLYTKVVKLVIFDEIHLLHNERGATLEALVARIKRHKEIEGESIRIVGLSATLPNYKDVWRFISPEDHDEKSVFYFDSSYRPIPLRQQYIGITETKKALRLINDIVYDKVMERLIDQTQILIFVHSREDTAKTGEYLKTKALEEHKLGLFLSSESALDKINESDKNMSTKLKELLRFGIGIHHAGLTRPERSCVESLFKDKYIKVLVSTATLAWGVNLPARTVIIKGTQLYSSRDGRWTDLDSLDVTQMLGRAGRPGYDKEGEGIVITQQSQVPFYMSLMTEQLPVESKLIPRLAEFLNAECVVENIESLEDGCEWLNETFLSSRMASILDQADNRQYLTIYGIKPDAKRTDPKLVEHKRYLVDTALRTLDKRGLIVYDRLSGAVKSTELGRIASIFNCSSRTIKMFYDSIHEFTSDIELFRTFSLADEFKDIYVRRGEEVDFQTLLNQIPFPIDDKRATPGANKVNALLQVLIFRMNIESSDLISDMHFIRDNAPRLARAIHEIVLMKGYALVAELSFDLCRKIDKRMTVCHSPLRQFSADLDADIINRLEKKNYHIDELRALKADKICELLRCERKYGEIVYRLLKCLPRLKIEASVKPVSKNSLKVELSIQPDFTWSDKYHGYTEQFLLLVEDVNQETLLHYEVIHIKKNRQHEKTTTTFYVPYLVPMHPFYYLRIFPDKWFGSDHHLPIYIEKLSLPDEVVNYTQALDLEPQPVRSLENALFERIYEDKFRGANFNQFQTQAFKHIYLSDEDLILLASAGSGKTTCAELAIIRNINLKGTGSKCAYIAANPQSAQMVFDSWTKLFGRHYGLVFLTGNHRVDAARVDGESSNIVIGDPASWHVLTLTRSKKYRKLLSKFHLFIIDDIHLLHNDENSTLEWLCSKIRITTKLNAAEKPARVVALGSPMASTDSIKSWLAFERGTKEPVLLNYPPSIRPVKLELTVQRYHHYDYKMRLLTMQRPVYRHLVNAKDKPTLIFVADFHQAQVVCDSLISYSRKKGGQRFARPMVSLSGVSDPDLKDYLAKGVGFIYMGMNTEDKLLVERLFDSGQLLILVVTVAMCWAIQSRSNLTIIMDTQQHNGIEASEYKLTDMMQMIGLTGRPMADHECSCIVMCHYSKANHYERFLREPLSSESELPSNLIAHINYEVATGEITELNNIYKPYLAHTFFYKRISVNPNYYGIILPEDSEQKSKVFGSFFNNLVNKVALDLDKAEFISMEGSHENPNFTAGLLSRISLEYYINYETLSNYTKWLATTGKQDIRPLELIELISTSTFEFRRMPVRHGELPNLKSLQRRHRPREGDQIHDVGFKIKLLILSQYQKTDGKADELEGELIADRWFVITQTHRLLMAVVDIAWLKDSFSLAKTAIQLSKKIVPFSRSTLPNIDMETSIAKEGDEIVIGITVKRENEPFSQEEFNRSFASLPTSMYRDEGWCFLIHGQPRVKKSEEPDKFLLFKRVKTPAVGINEYKLNFVPTENASSYTYDLYLMSDFYSTKEDRKVANIDVIGLSLSS